MRVLIAHIRRVVWLCWPAFVVGAAALVSGLMTPEFVASVWIPMGFELGVYAGLKACSLGTLLCIKMFDMVPSVVLGVIAGMLIPLLRFRNPFRLALIFAVVAYVATAPIMPAIWLHEATYQLVTIPGPLVGTWLVVRRQRARAKQVEGSCRECGYDLTGNVSGVCPECGTRIEKKQG